MRRIAQRDELGGIVDGGRERPRHLWVIREPAKIKSTIGKTMSRLKGLSYISF